MALMVRPMTNFPKNCGPLAEGVRVLDFINPTIGAFQSDEAWQCIEKVSEASAKRLTGATAYKLTPTDYSALK